MRRKNTGLITKTIRHSKRFREIALVLIRYGFTDYLTVLGLDNHFRFIKKRIMDKSTLPPENLSREALTKQALEALGPTFVKLGQLLSNRPDLIPPALIKELVCLQDDVQTISATSVKKIVEREFKRPCNELFLEFDEQPIASASIAQVHRVRLPNGMPAVVKIQRPDIWDNMEIDLDILHGMAMLAEKNIPDARFLQPVQLVQEFRKRLLEETDFHLEARNMQRFRELFSGRNELAIPKVYPAYSTKHILCMEMMQGEKLSTVLTQEKHPEKQQAIAQSLTNLMLEQIFVHGYFHADSHPGNILILENNRIGFLDFGMVGKLRPREKHYLSQMLAGIVHKDSARLSSAILSITGADNRLIREDIEDDVYDIVEYHIDLDMKQINTEQLFTELINLVVRKGIHVPANLLLFSKTILLLDGIIRRLAPNTNPLELFEPFVRSQISRAFSWDTIKREGMSASWDIMELLRHAPRDTREIISELKHGKIRIRFFVEGLDPLRETFTNISLRLVFGLLLASVIISSSVVIHAKIPPYWHDVPVLGILGFIIAGIISAGYILVLAFKFLRRLYRR